MKDGWTLAFDGFDPPGEGLREALCALGNGRFVTRGAAEEAVADGVHYPGTYVAGGYDRLASEVAGRTVENEDLVNLPNWLPLVVRPDDGEWLRAGDVEVLECRQELRMREGILVRTRRLRDGRGRITSIESRRLVHMRRPHLGAIELRVRPENWSGAVVVRSGLDGAVTNDGVARYRQLAGRHLRTIARAPVAPEGIHLHVETVQSRLEIATAARTRLFGEGVREIERRTSLEDPDRIFEQIGAEIAPGGELRIEKLVSLYTSRDAGISEASLEARLAIGRTDGFAGLLEEHAAAWRMLWDRHDVRVEMDGDEADPGREQTILRLHVFHLLQTLSPNTIGLDVGTPARGLHGEAYRGHVFWDEIFVLPLLTLRDPAITRSLLLYRYHRLDAARSLARLDGHRGACFPWQSSSDGREATQEVHLNPRSGRWDPDRSRLQRHVGLAVALNLWRYYEATGDRDFLERHGAEMLIEIARYWSSLATWNETTGRYDVSGVMGPDEYHEGLPGTAAGGLCNNAYSNVMAVWCLIRAREALEVLPPRRSRELLDVLGVQDAELARWDDVSRKITVPFVEEGVIEQFEGYRDLEELDWDGYRRRYGDVSRLDRILKAEGRSPDAYKVSKQADVNMIAYLLEPDEIHAILRRLGYDAPEDLLARNVAYYRPRTSHGSTLSAVVFASVMAHLDLDASAELHREALRSDVDDLQGGTTPEGIHLGAMAGTLGTLLERYAGVRLHRDHVSIRPALPSRIGRIGFRLRFRGRWMAVDLSRSRVRLAADEGEVEPIPVRVAGRALSLEPGRTIDVDLDAG